MLLAILMTLHHVAAAAHHHHGCTWLRIIYTGTVGHPGYVRRVLSCPVVLRHHWVGLGG